MRKYELTQKGFKEYKHYNQKVNEKLQNLVNPLYECALRDFAVNKKIHYCNKQLKGPWLCIHLAD
jgi:hypothetical protein